MTCLRVHHNRPAFSVNPSRHFSLPIVAKKWAALQLWRPSMSIIYVISRPRIIRVFSFPSVFTCFCVSLFLCWFLCTRETVSVSNRSIPRRNICPLYTCTLYSIHWSVANLVGAEPAPPHPLGDGLTPSLTVMLANAKFWSFYCKTLYSEYSKWLPPVAF